MIIVKHEKSTFISISKFSCGSSKYRRIREYVYYNLKCKILSKYKLSSHLNRYINNKLQCYMLR